MISVNLEINSSHPCRKCIVRPCCKLDCEKLVKYITCVFVATTDHLEKVSYSFYEKPEIKRRLLNKYVERFRPYPILGWDERLFHMNRKIK